MQRACLAVSSYPAEMSAEQTEEGSVVHISTDLTQRNSADISAAVISIMDESLSGSRIVVDLWGAAHIDSSGIGAILEMGRKAQTSGIRFAVCGLPESARRFLNRTGIANLLTIVEGRNSTTSPSSSFC